MSKIRKKLADYLNPRGRVREMSEELKRRITTFLADNDGLLVIVADPKSDAVVVGYRDQLEAHRVVHKSTGGTVGIISDMLDYKKRKGEGRGSIDNFLLVLDGSIVDIAKRLVGEGNTEPDQIPQGRVDEEHETTQ